MFRNPLRRRDPDRVAGGYKAALSNPNTTRSGRRNAKRELRSMVSFNPSVSSHLLLGCLTVSVGFIGSGKRNPCFFDDQDQAVSRNKEHTQTCQAC